MIHEYRTYTIYPQLLARYLELAKTKAIPIRKDDYGKLMGFWFSEAGPLCQIHHMWEYEGLDQRNSERARMVQNPAWMNEFISGAWPTMQRQEVRFMIPRSDYTEPNGDNIYETRVYRTAVGKFMATAAAVQERPLPAGATRVCTYTSESPEPNEVTEIIAYPDIVARYANHSQVDAQQKWLAEFGDLMHDVQSSILIPTDFSPLS